jgi:EAL domain-containing protein (putative c-di-GMP-specific phosphodiesterase class I)
MQVSSEILKLVQEEDFYHFFQPIYCLMSGKKLGMEALFRAELGTPDIVFKKAQQTQYLFQLDTQSISKALTTWNSLGNINDNELLFINVLPSTLLNSKFPFFLNTIAREYKWSNQNIVFELSESEQTFQTENADLLSNRINLLKYHGFLIAIDDLGKGGSSLCSLIDIDPHIVKLDRYFSINLAESKKKQMMIDAIQQYCVGNDIQIILEGIEEKVDLDMAKTLGISFAQGYFLGKPRKL